MPETYHFAQPPVGDICNILLYEPDEATLGETPFSATAWNTGGLEDRPVDGLWRGQDYSGMSCTPDNARCR